VTDLPEICGDTDPESGLKCGRAPHLGFHRHIFPDGRGHQSWCEVTSWFTPHAITTPTTPEAPHA
jgi:hypothetical protein